MRAVQKWKIGDCLKLLPEILNNSIDLVITSPPYDKLRTYDGNLTKYDFKRTARELTRVLKLGGHLVWVIGDETKDFCESMTSFKNAIFFVETCGLKLLDTMIYYKLNFKPLGTVVKRYTGQFEYMFVFTKGNPTIFNPIKIKKASSTPAGSSSYRQADGTLIKRTISEIREYRDVNNVWEYYVGGKSYQHPAVFPLQLVTDHIKSWTNEGDMVLDPFVGSGTTFEACARTNRNCIGFEIDGKYEYLYQKRINEAMNTEEIEEWI